MRVLNLVADDFELVLVLIVATPINLVDAAFVAELVLIAILVARGLRDAVPRASKVVASAFDQVIQCRTGRGHRAHDRQGGAPHVVCVVMQHSAFADALGGRKRGLGEPDDPFKADCLCFEVFRTELTD